MPRLASFVALTLFTALSSCASTPKIRPADLSVPEHDSIAAAEEQKAKEAIARYQAKTKSTVDPCQAVSSTQAGIPCEPGSTLASEDPDLAKAGKHRALAAAHRRAAEELKAAQRRACEGIAEKDRDPSPFFQPAVVESVAPLNQPGSRFHPPRLVGAKLTIRFVPGWSVSAIQRILDCHLARNLVIGWGQPGVSYSPFLPKGVTVAVSPLPLGFEIKIRAETLRTANAVLERARALVGKK